MKAIETLNLTDIEKYRVWRISGKRGDLSISPVPNLPCTNLNGKVAATKLQFANGSWHWGLVGNFDVGNPNANEQFLTLSLFHDGRWFHLARYFDFDFDTRGPEALARFVGLKVEDIFPISGTLKDVLAGPPDNMRIIVQSQPKTKLSLQEIMKLAVPPRKASQNQN